MSAPFKATRPRVVALWVLTAVLLAAATITGWSIIALWGLAISAGAAAASVNLATKRAVEENRREIEQAYKHGRRVSERYLRDAS